MSNRDDTEDDLRKKITKEPWFVPWTTGTMSSVRGLIRKASPQAALRISVLQVKGDVNSEYTNIEFPVLQERLRSLFKVETDFPKELFDFVTFNQLCFDDLEDELSLKTGIRTKNGQKTRMYAIIASAPEVYHEKITEIVSDHDNESYVTLSYSSRQAFENPKKQEHSHASVTHTVEALTISPKPSSARTLSKVISDNSGRTKAYPAGTIFEVEGAELAVLNGCYRADGTMNDRPMYQLNDSTINIYYAYAYDALAPTMGMDPWDVGWRWNANGNHLYHPDSTDSSPPKSGWLELGNDKPSNLKITYVR